MEAMYAKFSSGNTRAASSSITEEYQEEEVWAVLDKPKEDDSSNTFLFDASSTWGVRAPRPIRRATSLGVDHHHQHHKSFTITHSAPVSNPDWCKFLNISPKKNLQISDDDECDHNDDDDDDMLPPHEFLARRYARTRVVSSIYEGVGRTLKGRDLINLRNAVLRKTGFIE